MARTTCTEMDMGSNSTSSIKNKKKTSAAARRRRWCLLKIQKWFEFLNSHHHEIHQIVKRSLRLKSKRDFHEKSASPKNKRVEKQYKKAMNYDHQSILSFLENDCLHFHHTKSIASITLTFSLFTPFIFH